MTHPLHNQSIALSTNTTATTTTQSLFTFTCLLFVLLAMQCVVVVFFCCKGVSIESEKIVHHKLRPAINYNNTLCVCVFSFESSKQKKNHFEWTHWMTDWRLGCYSFHFFLLDRLFRVWKERKKKHCVSVILVDDFVVFHSIHTHTHTANARHFISFHFMPCHSFWILCLSFLIDFIIMCVCII